MNIEEGLWNYIDGACTDEEQKAVSILIAQDESWRRKYDELLALNREFSKMDADEPSMAFTYNVMEVIRAGHATQPLKAMIDKRIIKGIAVFFILTILVLVVFTLSTVHLSSGSVGGSTGFALPMPDNFKMPDIKNYFNVRVLEGFVFFDVVLGLFLFDSYLRKRRISKQS